MAPYDELYQLGGKIECACVENFEGHQFLPENKLKELVTENNVRSILKETNFPDVEVLVPYVLDHARRLFLILVLMSSRKDPSTASGFCGYPAEATDPTSCSSVFHGWERNDRDNFKHYQLRFLAPVFGRGVFHFRFAAIRTLPYLDVAPVPASSGFFGEVYRKVIHRAHLVPSPSVRSLVDTNTGGVVVAVKKAKNVDQLGKYFGKEADNGHTVREYNSPHLIKPIAAYQIGQEKCLVFPWADGGNLSNYWHDREADRYDTGCVKWIIRQFLGICSALKELHERNARHGDLKPEYIFLFRDGLDMGTLQIADVGLAAFHEPEVHTEMRHGLMTETPSGTSRYEPPEMDKDRYEKKPRSRQYDIWSMGCITLELLIWLTSGYSAVTLFRRNTQQHFWWCNFRAEKKVYLIEPYVDSIMTAMEKRLTPNGAYKDLLQLVRDRLLIIDVSPSYKSSPEYREIAEEVRNRLQSIQQNCSSNPSYLHPVQFPYPLPELGNSQKKPSFVYEKDGHLAAPGLNDTPRTRQTLRRRDDPPLAQGDDTPRVLVHSPSGEHNLGSLDTQVSRISDNQEVGRFRTRSNLKLSKLISDFLPQSRQLNDVWQSYSDNKFALELLNLIEWERVKPNPEEVDAQLCSSCSLINSTTLFDHQCNFSALQSKSQTCELCRLLLNALKKAHIAPNQVVTLRQNGATVGVENGPDLLSVYTEPNSNIPKGAQLGFPRLLEKASSGHFTLLKEWIRVCDSAHKACHRNIDASVMPTRLLDVSESPRIVECASIEPAQYVALSHCWGSLEDNEKFCTYKHNIEELKKFISFESLPRTFRDAVVVTRGLGIKYIWIDSLCIVQNDREEWESESAKMRQVFSAAYCTIGTSSAKSSLDGFLAHNDPRVCVQIPTRSLGIIYACPFIDSFQTDVELGELNRRGWVLQERALSRRTIFYTSTQVYWECGEGVHCETLARLKNSKAALLGDSDFPSSALEYYRDGRQMLIQDLYEKYSELAFTVPSDRAVAILGLQERLARAYRSRAAYGFFAVYFARGLLWKRRNIQPMEKISQPAGRIVPSWSWLSKNGAIKYMDLKFQEVEWATDDFENPFARPKGANLLTLCGVVRKLTMSKRDMLTYTRIDDKQEYEVDELRCVVIGRSKDQSNMTDAEHHVLVVHQLKNVLGKGAYERVGVGSLRLAHVDSQGSWGSIR